MVWKKVNNSDAGDATHFGGDDFDKVANIFSDVVGVDTIAIDSTVKLVDSKFTIRDNSDLTKSFAVECSGITTATTRTMTIPNADFTPVTIAEVETITGVKTFGTAGGAVSKLKVAGATSGVTILDATPIAGAGTVTLPTTGTLATLAGAETLSAKTLTAAVRIENALGSALATTGTVDLDFSTNELVTMAAMTGNVTFTTSNRVAGRTKTIRIIGGASAFTFTFPAWKFLGAAAPASLAIGKYAVLTITSISTTDAEVVAAYSAQV